MAYALPTRLAVLCITPDLRNVCCASPQIKCAAVDLCETRKYNPSTWYSARYIFMLFWPALACYRPAGLGSGKADVIVIQLNARNVSTIMDCAVLYRKIGPKKQTIRRAIRISPRQLKRLLRASVETRRKAAQVVVAGEAGGVSINHVYAELGGARMPIRRGHVGWHHLSVRADISAPIASSCGLPAKVAVAAHFQMGLIRTDLFRESCGQQGDGGVAFVPDAL